MFKCFHTLRPHLRHTQFSFSIGNKANNEMSLPNTQPTHILNTILIISYVAGAEGDLSNNVTEYECAYEFEYEYNHADIVYVYAAHAKSHHSFTHTLTYTHTDASSRHA